jgi:tripartite ATP-independent transporter DctM subunit
MPIAFSLLIPSIAVMALLKGEAGITQVILGISTRIGSYTLMPIVLFILMGEVLFESRVGIDIIDALDKWFGRLPGRLGLLAVGSGTLIATLTGASMASCAIMGATLTPEMEKRGYQKSMSLGPVIGSAGLAILIPPSALAVYLGALGRISIGQILIAIVIPGLTLALFYALYIVLRCTFQPNIAPQYAVKKFSASEKILATVRYILPAGMIIFLVTGVIILGITTPSEAAATGVAGSFLLAGANGRLNWKVIKKIFWGAFKINILIFTVMVGAFAFTQTLTFSGSGRGLLLFIMQLPLPPILIFISIQLLGLLLGMFLVPVGVMTIIVPLFKPVLDSLGFDAVWFATLLLLNVEIGNISPPFGQNLIIMKGVAPPGTTMEDIYKAGLPFVGCGIVVMILILTFPQLALWLPNLIQH